MANAQEAWRKAKEATGIVSFPNKEDKQILAIFAGLIYIGDALAEVLRQDALDRGKSK